MGTPLTLEHPQTFKLPGSSGWGPGLRQELWDTCLQGTQWVAGITLPPLPISNSGLSVGRSPHLRNVKPHPWQLLLHLQDDASVWKVQGNGPAVVRATQAGPPVPSGTLRAGLWNLRAVGKTLSRRWMERGRLQLHHPMDWPLQGPGGGKQMATLSPGSGCFTSL